MCVSVCVREIEPMTVLEKPIRTRPEYNKNNVKHISGKLPFVSGYVS